MRKHHKLLLAATATTIATVTGVTAAKPPVAQQELLRLAGPVRR